ncbi:HlyD family efflux transporter periplasmic adaptor subunit [Lutibacter sp. TH_r2]|uniref:efflux RND transporter periplasmic adaptor subunit n=1 Tax=Lutibacter sp. TH_r2 TaxID=3082083 RepID=UPI002953A81A|nr:HlyD family efflux transporter periplasmic adaptor subunit [Lutibacter sp. TH_r2]MDV7188369.1 HlyD family efflux transporter periplasmic adaptor subunit [Lutibacter sp. TH_r2]
MRQKIIIAGSILLLVLAVFAGTKIAEMGSKEKPKFNKVVKTVYTKTVNNKAIPVKIITSGNLAAKNKIDLYTEVQGILNPMKKEFRAGTKFYKGQTILSINSDEFYANLQAQKSAFFNSLTSVMPDIQLDFPNQYVKWQNYLNSLDINKTTPKLPSTNSDKEKFFISGRGILTSYYNVKNLEAKLIKYNIRAPFNGTLTETLVAEGSLVRSGQKLGEFINTDVFELEVNVNEAYADLLKIGNKVTVSNINNTKSWEATVIRVNAKVDQTTQSIKAYLQIKGEGLRDGMYLNAALQTKKIENATEIPRKLLVEDTKVFIINDTILNLKTINPVYFNNETVIIKGLENGTTMLSRSLPGAYDGMLVKTINETE